MLAARSGGGGGRLGFAPEAVLKGTLVSLGIALIISLVLSTIITLAGWESFPSYLGAFHYISIALGGILAARRARSFGWLHGGAVGILYTVLLAFLFTDGMTFGALLQGKGLLDLLYGLAAGVAGGVLGVNA
jgi:putative membrane protein (TIGR04086 family)